MIQVEGLGKRYRIANQSDTPRSGWRGITDALQAPFGYLRQSLRAATEEETLWAIKDVNFEVRRGQVMGIIGRNGSGKSTLLKILSRLTDPTEGSAILRGRVGSLLEAGTGFHPELTGRENIYLRATILGMKKREIDRKMDEIIEFSEIGRFLDTPVKRYSSGMGVRLGFAVAAQLEPEILIVDEVLAVGDLGFQRKCLAKLESIAAEGRTVLFVSHAMPSIQALCHRVLLLDGGRIVRDGAPSEVVNLYEDQQHMPGAGQLDLRNHPNRITTGAFFQSLAMRNAEGKETDRFRFGDKITFELRLDIQSLKMDDPFISIHIQRHGQPICYLNTHFMHKAPVTVNNQFIARCTWDPGWLAPGNYVIQRLAFKKRSGSERLDQLENIGSFEIFPTDVYGTGSANFPDSMLIPIGGWEFAPTITDS